jgi:hypothetical protein
MVKNEMIVNIADGKKLNGHLKTGSKQKIKTFQTFVKTKVTNLK